MAYDGASPREGVSIGSSCQVHPVWDAQRGQHPRRDALERAGPLAHGKGHDQPVDRAVARYLAPKTTTALPAIGREWIQSLIQVLHWIFTGFWAR
jgi:hypothetical protein